MARSVLQLGLKPATFSDQPRVLILTNSPPLIPSYWGPFLRDGKPQSLAIDPKKPILVLTGPNSSGKTVLTFNVWLKTQMALRGFHVPGGLELSRFDKVYAFFGGQNLASQNESYF